MPRGRRSGRRIASVVGLFALIALAGGFGARHWFAPRVATPLLLRQAIAAIEAKDNLRAVRLLDTILEREPANDAALLYRGEMARDGGDRPGAAKYWSMIPDDHPNEAGTARFLEGVAALAAHRAVEAERLFRRSTELHPSYLRSHEMLMHLFLLQLRDAELRGEMAQIRRFRRWSLEELVWSIGSMGKIHPVTVRSTTLEKFVAGDNDDLASTLALAECFLADDRPDKAVELLDRSLTAHPGEASLRGRLAELLVNQGDLERARELLGQGPALENAPVQWWRGNGAFLAATGDWTGAVRCLERAMQLEPDHFRTAHGLGLAFERVGRHDEAMQMLRRARLMEQVVLEAWRLESADSVSTRHKLPIVVQIARLLSDLKRHDEATAWLEQALDWNPGDSETRAFYERTLGEARALASAGANASVARAPATLPATPAEIVRLTEKPDRAVPGAPGAAAGPLSNRLKLVDRHAQAGIDFEYHNGANGSKFLLESVGGGVAAFDYDADGWPDLYFTQGCPLPVAPGNEVWRDKLFRNCGGTFRDVSEDAGLGDAQYSQGCSAADFDNDGFVDLAVANFGTNVLYLNNGDGTFRDVTLSAGITGEHWSSSLAFADLDRDGNLDLYVVTYVSDAYRMCRHPRIATCSPLNYKAEQDQLFRSRGDGTFDDVTLSSGVVADDGKGLGIVVADFDEDGWPDIYVANDGTPNFLFHNETASGGAPLQFVERGLPSGAGVSGSGNSQAGMGIACADFDGDGRLDLFVTNFYRESSTFYRNQGDLLFIDATRAARLDEPTRQFLGFGTQPIDVDLDGRPDLFIANGHIDDFSARGEPWKMRPQLFHNAGGATFIDVSRESGDYFTGEYLGRGVARLDWDRDGRADLAVVHQDRPVALLRNETDETGNRLVLDLHGVESNRDAIGARIAVTSGGTTRIHEICGGDGFFASNERRIISGLGSATTIERLEVRWPSGQTDEWADLPANAELIVIEGRSPVIHNMAAQNGDLR